MSAIVLRGRNAAVANSSLGVVSQVCLCLAVIGCAANNSDQPVQSGPSETPPAQSAAIPTSGQRNGTGNYAELLDEADAYAASGDFAAAIDRYRALIATAPERTEGYSHRADVLVSMSALKEALKDYRAALRLAPDDGALYLKRAKALVIVERLEMARSDCDRAIQLRPKWGEAYLVRGNIRLRLHDLDGAIADFDVAIRLMENPASPYNNRGVAHLQKGQTDLALSDYTAALKHSREFADAYNNRGDLFARRGKLDDAVADFSESIRIAPESFRADENRADVYMRQKRPDKARADYTTIIERSLAKAAEKHSELRPGPKLGRIYRKRATASFALNQMDDAMSDINESIDLNPGDPEAFAVRQQIYLSKGQTKDAENDQRRATELRVRQLPRASF